MKYIKCKEKEATHVRVLNTEFNQKYDDFLKLTLGEVYEIIRNTEPVFEGEEMIKNDDGEFVCSFSIGLEFDWLKEAQ